MRFYNTKKVLSKDQDATAEYTAPTNTSLNMAVWGALNKCVYAVSTMGEIFQVEASGRYREINRKQVHKNEIFSIRFTNDFTMLVTCSRDSTAKLLHPHTLEEVRVFTYADGMPCRTAMISPLFEHPE